LLNLVDILKLHQNLLQGARQYIDQDLQVWNEGHIKGILVKNGDRLEDLLVEKKGHLEDLLVENIGHPKGLVVENIGHPKGLVVENIGHPKGLVVENETGQGKDAKDHVAKREYEEMIKSDSIQEKEPSDRYLLIKTGDHLQGIVIALGARREVIEKDNHPLEAKKTNGLKLEIDRNIPKG
jgi:hypothetical protein